ncbi:MAG: UvrD-helicase domain-containing protein, partial [Nostocoides sp.]
MTPVASPSRDTERPPRVVLRRSVPYAGDLPSAAPPDLDAAQLRAVAFRGGVARVLGAPGTGKSTVAVEVAADRVRSGELTPDQCLLVAPTRVAAARLRDAVTARVGGTSTSPLARTLPSFAFGILRQAAALAGDPTPRLLSGPEQDLILRDLLAGHASGDGTDPGWPASVVPALPTRGFRTELRDLLMRAVEHDLDPESLAALGASYDRPEWVAGARVLAEYDEVTALSAPGAFDPAWILGFAADLLRSDDQALARVRETVRCVVVDDAQELTPAAVRLL